MLAPSTNWGDAAKAESGVADHVIVFADVET